MTAAVTNIKWKYTDMKKNKIDKSQFLSLPAAILYGVFFVYPLLCGVGMSFTDWD